MNLYLLQYNNYYNRIFKKEDSISDYLPYMINNTPANNPMTYVNLIPGDGLHTEQDIDITTEFPDYVVYVDEYNNIQSRWFVIETSRNSAGQYKASLRRDIIADYWDNIASAPMFIEKGYCSISDNFIFNDEQITVNQIKQSEILLKDSTYCPWVVGYCALPEGETTPTRITYGSSSDVYDFYTPTLEDWEYADIVVDGVKFPIDFVFDFRTTDVATTQTYTFQFDKNGASKFIKENGGNSNFMTIKGSANTAYQAIDPAACNTLYQKALEVYDITDDPSLYARLQKLAGSGENKKILKIGDGTNAQYAAIGLKRIESSLNKASPAEGSVLYNAWKDWCTALETSAGRNLFDNTYKKLSFATSWHVATYEITLTQITPYSELEFYFPYGRKALTDAPYCMFAMPYGELFIKSTEEGGTFFTDANNALSLAAGIAKSLGSKLYDIQLLPYCPIPLIRNRATSAPRVAFDEAPFNSWTKDEHYVIIPSAKQVLFFCEQSSDSFDIDVSSYSNLLYRFYNSLEFKANMLTTKVRLCSPNYNGVFEFNSYKNRGCDIINVDYTYKPFQPYIHLNPRFNGLYGEDFDDARGLICGGDFSLPITSDRWIEYQIQNKTYQEQFNRKIENMEIQHKYKREQEAWQIAAGAIGGAVSGAATGVLASGSPYGALAGLATGGMSLAAGIRDRQINDALRDEAKDYTKDLFKLELDNIQALPDSLTRVSAFNKNNKLFPFIEIYGCTDEEMSAVWNKLTYNGFTIGRIDTLQNNIDNKPIYMGNPGYFKGQLIRLQDFNEDSHLANAIAGELYKGVYV